MWMLPLWLWILFPGCVAVTGPRMVTGPEGGSVSVTCSYNWGYEMNGKFWCRKRSSVRCSDGFIIRTSGSEAKVQKGRFSIQDNHSLRVFTATMKNLTETDAGTYHCGVVINSWSDPRHAVEVIVSPVLPTSMPSTMEPLASTESTTPIFTSSISTEDKASMPPAVHSMGLSSQDSHVHFLLLVGLKVPVFLCMVCAVVWVSVRYRGSSND
ncbi:CMRF35-like molecule 2 [Alligator mississippiensis]|uniref:CMRF35-like molecule 2 n=1 Tax=Alligator mississippiensis TaxID=8496 RepID=UPI0009071398|nr:CMRF35-like molecule 2 [Alligator mississippiensis]XP_019349713.1 CMRF35-like molecule 2 [Alligator mississippiensis]